MKLSKALLALLLCTSAVVWYASLGASDAATFQVYEFATIRWGGRDNTQLIRPNGRTEKLRPILERAPRPDGIDERTYYMSIAMNAVAREGFDVAAMTQDEIVMRRPVTK